MNTSVHHIATYDKTAFAGGHSLREGGFVFIRVVSDNGSGNYTVSLGENRFTAFSDKPLSEGSVFRVQVTVKDGQIRLVPEQSATSGGSQAVQTDIYRLTGAMFADGSVPGQLQNMFASLGLPVDAVSLRLISFLQQTGLKLDSERMIKSRRIATRFPGREAEAAEIALSLAEKGIEPDVESVAAMMNMLFYRFAYSDDGCGSSDNSGVEGAKEPTDGLFERLYGLNLASVTRDNGILTLSNHLTADGLHWIVLPFEYTLYEKRVFGNIRILIDAVQKNMQKMILEAEHTSKKYFFVLYYNRNVISHISFRMEPPPESADVLMYEKMLESVFSSDTDNSTIAVPNISYDASAASGALYGGAADQITRIYTEA